VFLVIEQLPGADKARGRDHNQGNSEKGEGKPVVTAKRPRQSFDLQPTARIKRSRVSDRDHKQVKLLNDEPGCYYRDASAHPSEKGSLVGRTSDARKATRSSISGSVKAWVVSRRERSCQASAGCRAGSPVGSARPGGQPGRAIWVGPTNPLLEWDVSWGWLVVPLGRAQLPSAIAPVFPPRLNLNSLQWRLLPPEARSTIAFGLEHRFQPLSGEIAMGSSSSGPQTRQARYWNHIGFARQPSRSQTSRSAFTSPSISRSLWNGVGVTRSRSVPSGTVG
jgi:hypothetical protein